MTGGTAATCAVVETMMRIKVLSKKEILAGEALGADGVISIRGSAPGAEPDLAAALAQATRGESARLLRLVFDDVALPSYRHLVGPTMSQIQDAVDFGRTIASGRNLFDGAADDPLIVVHCEHGKSRSAAVALALLADHHGVGQEVDAVNELMRGDITNRMHPNPLVVSLADRCLWRYGRLETALVEASPNYFRWREVWREIALDPEAAWQRAARLVRRKRLDSGAA